MSKVMTSEDFVKKAKDIAKNYKTLYVMGCFGSPMNDKNKKRYCNNHSYNKKAARTKMIKNATSDTFGFDCVCLIKGILWGWNGDKTKTYGGSNYGSNGVPDIGADTIIKSSYCSGVSTDFKNIAIGEILWMSGHVGIYIGDGLAVECSPAWDNDVQITAVKNIGTKKGYNARKWTKHGKLKYIDYSSVEKPVEVKPNVIYQAYDNHKKKWLGKITNYNNTNSDGYSGIKGHAIGGIRIKLSDGSKITIKSHYKGGKWLGEITKWDDTSNGYSGIKGKPIDAVMIKADKYKISYRVHLKAKNKWLNWISGYNTKDAKNGYAGIIGQEIDMIQVRVD